MWDEGQKHNAVVTEVKLHCFHVSAAVAANFLVR